MRTLITMLCAAALCATPFAPASAEPEPDNALWEATGPVLTDTITGILADSQDRDWYMLYAAANTELGITLAPACRHQKVTLRDAEGQQLAVLSGSATLPATMTYPVGPQTRQFLLLVTAGAGSCPSYNYSITLSPAGALQAGPGMPTSTPLTEADQRPLTGDTWYAAEITPTDPGDDYSIYAAGPVTVKAVNSACEMSATLWDDTGDDVARTEVGPYQYTSATYNPPAWEHLRLTFARTTNYPDPPTCTYRFLLSPASSVKDGPRPLAPPTSKVAGLKYAKVGKRVIVRWTPMAGARWYELQTTYKGEYTGWRILKRTQWSIKAKNLPKKGIKVQVRAANNDGKGPVRTLKVKR